MNTFYRYGFFTTSGINILLILLSICYFCVKKNYKHDNNEDEDMRIIRRDIENVVPPLAQVAPVAAPVEGFSNLKIDTRMVEMNATSIIEEGVKTPGGTTIRRRSVQI